MLRLSSVTNPKAKQIKTSQGWFMVYSKCTAEAIESGLLWLWVTVLLSVIIPTLLK